MATIVTTRRLVLIGLVLVYLALPVWVDLGQSNPIGLDPVVLVVGDFSPGGFGEMVYQGVALAERATEKDQKLNLRVIRVAHEEQLIPETSTELSAAAFGDSLEKLKKTLTRAIARYNVASIVSANTSQTAPAVLETGKAFGIPILLTVATNGRIMDGYNEIALRLLPTDTKQAAAIAAWCKENVRDGRLGVLYDPNRYGNDLRSMLRTALGPTGLLDFSVGTTTDVAGSLKYGREAGVGAWVFIGYREQAIEVLAKKYHLRVPGAILLTDGAYGPWLAEVHMNEVYLTFPGEALNHTVEGDVPDLTSAAGSPDQDSTDRVLTAGSLAAFKEDSSEELRGYAVYGHDAYQLTLAALHEAVRLGSRRDALNSLLRLRATYLSDDGRLLRHYAFDSDGENQLATFEIYRIGNSHLP